MNSFTDLRPLDMAEIQNLKPEKPFPTSSSFYDDLNLDGCSKNDKFLSNFISSQNNDSNMAYLNQLTVDSSSHDLFEMNLTKNDSFNVKKKKLTNYSISSSNLPSMSLSSAIYNENSHSNEDDNSGPNFSNSSFSLASSRISASSSCNSNLSSYSRASNNANNGDQNYYFGKVDGENFLSNQNWGDFNSNDGENGTKIYLVLKIFLCFFF